MANPGVVWGQEVLRLGDTTQISEVHFRTRRTRESRRGYGDVTTATE